jgi:hypothetical protein
MAIEPMNRMAGCPFARHKSQSDKAEETITIQVRQCDNSELFGVQKNGSAVTINYPVIADCRPFGRKYSFPVWTSKLLANINGCTSRRSNLESSKRCSPL